MKYVGQNYHWDHKVWLRSSNKEEFTLVTCGTMYNVQGPILVTFKSLNGVESSYVRDIVTMREGSSSKNILYSTRNILNDLINKPYYK